MIDPARERGVPYTYFVNGEVVGTGKTGRQMVLKRLAELPVNSRVVIYPREPQLHEMNWKDNYPSAFPYEELDVVVSQRSLIVYISEYDERGQRKEFPPVPR